MRDGGRSRGRREGKKRQKKRADLVVMFMLGGLLGTTHSEYFDRGS